MKDNKRNPQYTNLNYEENSNQKEGEGQEAIKRLENRPGTYLLKDKAEDEETLSQEDEVAAERSDLDEEVTAEDEESNSFMENEFNEDELNLNPFDDDNIETQD
jgi:hypothetical protein